MGVEVIRKRDAVVARCYVLRADRNGRVWYVAKDGGPPTMLPRFAEEHATLGAARDAKYSAILPEWKIWRRGRRA